MGLSNVTKMLALSCPPPPRSVQSPSPNVPLPPDVVVLKHCRCMDCRNFSKVNGDYFCAKGIGGTAVVWGTGRRVCEPAPGAWHYCAGYHGPQISKDVWLWPRTSHQVGAGSTIAPKAEQPGADEELA